MRARLRLMQMTSQAFPIGGYSHSYGFESAIDEGRVHDEATVQEWIGDVLSFSMTSYEMPMLLRMSEAWVAQDAATLTSLNEEFLATREAAELRAATVQMGYSLRKLLDVLPALPSFLRDTLRSMTEPSLPCAWSGAAHAWGIAAHDSAAAYLWTWAENQVLVAMKAVPIGQSAGQRVLLHVGELIAVWLARLCAAARADADGAGADAGGAAAADPGAAADAADAAVPAGSSNFAPGLAILCARHETQYSRLFRS